MANRQQPQRDSFFLPDLCNAQALLVLVVLAILLALLLTTIQSGLVPFNWQAFSLTSLFCLWSFLACAALLCSLRAPLSTLSMPVSGSLCLLLIIVAVAVFNAAAQWLLGSNLGAGIDVEQVGISVLVAAIVAGVGLRYFYLSWQLRLHEQSELKAKLQALQSRIRPHFLFNSLNSIAGLIAEDADKAETAVEDLSALFRASLQNVDVMSTWQAERQLCERYLRIEHLRLGERLQLNWQVEDSLEDFPMLSLSLQPLLENAIAHGIQQLPEGGCISITVQRSQGMIEIEVRNPLPAAPVKTDGTRTACDNLGHRLAAMYGESAKFLFGQRDAEFVVSLRFPEQLP